MGFFDALGQALTDKLGISDSNSPSLDPTSVPFSALGDFANKIDRSAQRSYTESGTINSLRPRSQEITWQQPDFTILVKKKLFSSLAENYRYDLMDAEEKLFIRASKKLFQNKALAIAAYEKLTKFEKLVLNRGPINDFVLGGILQATNTLQGLGVLSSDNKFSAQMEKIYQAKTLSEPNFYTTWIVERNNPFNSNLGEGTGVLEITMASSVTTTSSLKFGGGTCNITIEDPYDLFNISEKDINKALSDSTNLMGTNNFMKVSASSLTDAIEDLKFKLSNIRTKRGATQINILQNPTTLLSKKVRAFIDEEDREIIFNYDGGFLGFNGSDGVDIDSSAFEGPNGLKNDEIKIFQSLISSIYVLFGLQNVVKTDNNYHNQSINSVRQQLTQWYEGKSLIAVMDVVHVYMSSQTQLDPKINQGLRSNFSNNSILNKLNDTVGYLQNTIEDVGAIFSASSNTYLASEKNIIAGPDFPDWLWSQMRNTFIRQGSGAHVFAGLVDAASTRRSQNGVYNLTINCKDNCAYFDLSKVNFVPATDVYNGSLYDPLTPYKLEFDPATGFTDGSFPPPLDENIALLASGAAKFTAGQFKGLPATEANRNKMTVEKFSGSFRKVFNDPDGFIYRWKRGIGTVVNDGRTQDGTESTGVRSTFDDPFAGQDVMNALSLLICGQPYNFNTYLKSALETNNVLKEQLTNATGISYFKLLLNQINKSNAVWGNFQPFKKLVLNDSAYTFLIQGQFDLTQTSSRLNNLISQRAKTFDQMMALQGSGFNNTQTYTKGAGGLVTGGTDTSVQAKVALDKALKKLDFEINEQSQSYIDKVNQIPSVGDGASIKIYGDDVSLEPAVTGANQSPQASKQSVNREELRKRINGLTQRLIWKVKSNQDQNLFIVDDTYDKNLDIQAFEKALAGKMEKFASNYETSAPKITGIAGLIDLEVFADSQGHIQARWPQYNRIPSSVFRSMIQKRIETGARFFPLFLEKLFGNQVTSLIDQIEQNEDQIRLRTAALGFPSDNDANSYLFKNEDIKGSGFAFLSDSNTGRIQLGDLDKALREVAPDLNNKVSGFGKFKQALDRITKISSTFDITNRAFLVTQGQIPTSENKGDLELRINLIKMRLKTRNAAVTNIDVTSTQTQTFNLATELSGLVKEHQQLALSLVNAVKNLDQGLTINNDPDAQKNFLFPNLNSKKGNAFPEILEHMIEDEDVDDYGPGAGRRFILSDEKVIDYTITENPPDYTSVQVVGKVNQFERGFQNADAGPQSIAASATDYDMWRQYGFKLQAPINSALFSNSYSQCAPYAVFLLNRARANIHRVNVTVIGNEFIQPGEVYYLEDRNMLFYADSVTHSMSYGGTFTTVITGSYGHHPGEYIPNTLDIIGKGLYANRHSGNNMRNNRFNSGNNEIHLTTLTADDNLSDITSMLSGAYGKTNLDSLNKIRFAITGMYSSNSTSQKMHIELRNYKDRSAGLASSFKVTDMADSVKEWMQNPVFPNMDSTSVLPDVSKTPPGASATGISASAIQLATYDLDPDKAGTPEGLRSPSSLAWQVADQVSNTPGKTSLSIGGPPTAGQAFRLKEQALVNYVLDVWMVFDEPDQKAKSNAIT